ncbi:MAG: hypothetical protein MJH10_20775 [Epibacterium sp.]|nr:hypothetical protein [Epibacterium sp.]NQX75898.1 hypothetical protein [Epibacterium sp.]
MTDLTTLADMLKTGVAGPEAQAAAGTEITRLRDQVETLQKDADLLAALEANMWDLRTLSSQTIGGDDGQPGWEVVGHYMAKPHERVLGASYDEDPRPAIRQALEATK